MYHLVDRVITAQERTNLAEIDNFMRAKFLRLRMTD